MFVSRRSDEGNKMRNNQSKPKASAERVYKEVGSSLALSKVSLAEVFFKKPLSWSIACLEAPLSLTPQKRQHLAHSRL